MAEQSPQELLSHCQTAGSTVEIISSKYTWLKDSCLTASSVRQFVQHRNVSERLSPQTCSGSRGHTPGMPCICYRCIHHLPSTTWQSLVPEGCVLPPAQVTPGLCPEHTPALLQLCSACWPGTNPQLWVQGFCWPQAEQRKELQMQVPVQMGESKICVC